MFCFVGEKKLYSEKRIEIRRMKGIIQREITDVEMELFACLLKWIERATVNLLPSERPKLHSFGHLKCSRVKGKDLLSE